MQKLIFDLNEMKLDGGFKIKLPKNRIFANSVDISQDGEHLIFTVPKTNKAVLWKTSTKKPSANSKISFSNIQIVKTVKVDNEIYILLRVNKQELFRNLKTKFEILFKKKEQLYFLNSLIF
jgi:CRISPR/Cas system CSM-associated protein Csm5 (group 7 of RAMP superfamily)